MTMMATVRVVMGMYPMKVVTIRRANRAAIASNNADGGMLEMMCEGVGGRGAPALDPRIQPVLRRAEGAAQFVFAFAAHQGEDIVFGL